MRFLQITFGWRANQRWSFLPGFIRHIQDSEVRGYSEDTTIHSLYQKAFVDLSIFKGIHKYVIVLWTLRLLILYHRVVSSEPKKHNATIMNSNLEIH